MTLTQEHYQVALIELEFAMGYLRDFTSATGALNWRETNDLDKLANVINAHPLKTAVQELAEWLDAYQAGTATRAAWKAAILLSISNGFAVRGFLWERQDQSAGEG